MPLMLTEDATLVCIHEPGQVEVTATQDLVTVTGDQGTRRRVLVEPNPEGRPITGCPLVFPLLPCTTTLKVEEGYSDLVRIDGSRACLDTVNGFTVGSPPNNRYKVRHAGQEFVAEAS